MKINIVVCDDENIALKINCTYIEELSKKYRIDTKITGFLSGEHLLEYVEDNVIDIAFLDIDLKGMDGITLASRLLRKNPKIATIFVTSHREYAYDAFTVEAFSYLTKPIDPDRLERIFKKAILHVNDMYNRVQRVPLIITEGNIKRKINQSNIMFIERIGAQSIIVTRAGNYSVYESITSLIGRLEMNFLQINQGIIVNMDEISSVEGNTVEMKNNRTFSIGRTFSKDAKKAYLEYPKV